MIRLTLLGRLGLVGADGESLGAVLNQPKRLAVLAYLALAGSGQFRRRDTVLALFWPDATQEKARRSLNQTLHFLRQSLGGSTIVSRGPGELGVLADAFWCDAVAFDQTISSGDLADALRLYTGELLPGFFIDAATEFDQWLGSERRRLQRTAFAAAWKLAEVAENDGQFALAAQWGRIAVDLSLNDETTARDLILMLARIGDQSGAIEAYDAFAARLAREYNMRPSADLRRMAAEIRALVGEDVPEQGGTASTVAEEYPRAAAPPDDSVMSPAEDRAGALSVTANTAANATSRVPTTTRSAGRHRLPYWILAGALLASLGAIFFYYGNFSSSRRDVADVHRASIIVREFVGTRQPDSSQHLERALTAAIVDQLAQVQSFNVVLTPATVAARTRVDNSGFAPTVVLTGSVVQSNGQVRVNIQIADAESGRTIKTAVLERSEGQMLPLVDSLSLQTSSLVRTAVGRDIRLREWSRGANNKRAYALMLEADEHRDRATQLEASGDRAAAVRALRSADSALLRVEREAPQWSEPMVERTDVLQTLAVMYFMPPFHDSVHVRSSLVLGIAEGRRAVSLNARDASALEALGSVEYWFWLIVPLPPDSARAARTRAEQDLRGAVAADPTRAAAWSLLSASLYARADYVGAYLTADRAYRADAYLSSSETILDELFITSFEIGDGSAAVEWCDEINRRLGRGWLASYCRLRLLASNGSKDTSAIGRAWRIAIEVNDPASPGSAIPPQLQMRVATVIARQGLRDSAKAVMRDARARGGRDPELMLGEAEVWTRLGQADSATAILVRYVAVRPSHRTGAVRSRTFAGIAQLQRILTQMKIPTAARN